MADLRSKVFNMRMNEFGFSPVTFIDKDDDLFPYEIDIVMHEKTDPRKVYSVDLQDYVLSTENCFVIARLNWDRDERNWEFSSVGTRYLEYGTEELNKWILDFCNKYIVEYGELREK